MKFTQNYNLKKPDYSDFAEIPDHFNGNFDIIDEKLKEYIDALDAHKAENTQHYFYEENGSVFVDFRNRFFFIDENDNVFFRPDGDGNAGAALGEQGIINLWKVS